MKKIKPTIEQRLSDSYLQGYDEGSREQATVFEKYMDLDEAVSDYHKFNKYGQPSHINWCAVILTVLLLGVIASMIMTNYNYGNINV